MCQRSWLYLEPIFSSEDIIRQLPVESKRYQTMERIWRKIMKQAKENPEVKNRFFISNHIVGIFLPILSVFLGYFILLPVYILLVLTIYRQILSHDFKNIKKNGIHSTFDCLCLLHLNGLNFK